MAEKEQLGDENIGPGNCSLHGLSEKIKRLEAECGFMRDGRRVGCVKMRYQVIFPPPLPLSAGRQELNARIGLARRGSAGFALRSAGSRAGWLTDAHSHMRDGLCARAAHCS